MTDDEHVHIEKTAEELVKENEQHRKLLMKALEDVETERTLKEHAQSTLQLVAEKQFARRKKELNAPDNITTPEELQEWQKTFGKAPSGVIGLAGQLEGYYNEGEYSSYSEMFADLHKQLHHGNKQEQKRAKQILGKLSHKALRALKDRNKRIDIKIPSDEQIEAGISTVDLVNAWWRRVAKKDV